SSITFLVLLALERFVPYQQKWNQSDGQLGHDIGHMFFGTYLGATIGNVATITLTGLAASFLVRSLGVQLWPSDAHLVWQVLLLFLLADLGRYVQHRSMHEVPSLWRFHQLHHSVDVLNVWKTSRNHIVERIAQQMMLFAPAILLGASDEVLLPFIVANGLLGVYDHSNVDFRLGPIEYVFMGPEAHRIHHSRDLSEGNTNFGTALLVWDWLFGTYTAPPQRTRLGHGKVEVGIDGDDTPTGFLDQILDPFRRQPKTGGEKEPVSLPAVSPYSGTTS
ncbi:MAG: sterol desaturase family protein, partial [Myxococcales bacterium]|nr:sterol desaturase family protein [Myxococcales bacterium]